MSALEFTKRLALQFSHLQTNWKNKSDQLERELLRTRQELIKCQISSELSTTSNQFLPSPFGTLPPHVAPSTVSGVNFNFNPSNSTSFGINPSSSQQQQSRLPLSQLQIGNALSHHSQLFEFSSSQSSDGEWQSSGYCSSFPAQKENKSKRLALSDGGSCDVVMVDESQSCTEEGDGSNEMFAREAVANRKFDHDCDHDGGVGDSDLQEKIATHIKFCKSGMCIYIDDTKLYTSVCHYLYVCYNFIIHTMICAYTCEYVHVNVCEYLLLMYIYIHTLVNGSQKGACLYVLDVI